MSSPQNYSVRSETIRGLMTAWIEEGVSGHPIVFLCHGFPDNPEAWREQIDALKDRFHVVAPFVRGCEKSEIPKDHNRYSTNGILLDHLEILKKVDPSSKIPVSVMGHDLGVVHAMKLARSLGSRLASLTVINGTDVEMFGRRLGNPKQVSRSWYMGLMQIPMLPEALTKFAPKSCAWMAAEIGKLPENLRCDENFERRTVGPLNQYRAMARELAQKNRRHVKRIDAPVLIIWGRDDGFLEPPRNDEWAQVAKNFTIRIIEGGHWVHRESPSKVNPVITEFVYSAHKFLEGDNESYS